MHQRFGVIMAGGAGERFWPVSRRDRPKQLLRLTRADKTLLQESVDRLAPLIPPERILVATAAHLVEPIRSAGTGLPAENVIGEPCRRNTAGCLAFAAAHLIARGGDPATLSMAVLTADHCIGDEDRFREDVGTALAAAEGEGALVTIGVPPTRPETGYGYVEAEQAAPEGRAVPVSQFYEKPDAETARHYVDSGRFLWNSGMFFWTVAAFLSELDRAGTKHARAARAMAAALVAGDEERVQTVFEGLENISIDYALMEKAHTVRVVRARFAWDDVGAWDALDRSFPRDADGNVAVGDPVLIDTRDSVVYNEPGADARAVSVVGVEGLAVIVSADGVLVVPKDRAQDVRRAVDELKKRGAAQL
jgi:mannose-1-phosphate guanylyltransferase